MIPSANASPDLRYVGLPALASAGYLVEERVSPPTPKHYLGSQARESPRRWRWNVLNRYGSPSPKGGEAEVTYLDGDFRIVRPGAFVRCAVTGVPIPLDELKYWSVDLQEAYATPEAVMQRQLKQTGV